MVMAEDTIKLDARRCVGCHACELHCQAQHRLPAGMSLGRVLVRTQADNNGRPALLSAFVACLHCEQPWCLPACPTGAIRKDQKSGLVYVEDTLCVGCRSCVELCPWSAPQWDPARAKESSAITARNGRSRAWSRPAWLAAPPAP